MTIKQLQCLLTYLGYDPGTIDGVLGKNTTESLKEFQRDAIIVDDGIPGPVTETALIAAVKGNHFKNKTKEDKKEDNWWDSNSEYISRSECACPCGRCNGFPYEPDKTLVEIANSIRKEAGVPFIISSFVRCAEHNREVGGVYNSLHLTGKAVDFCLRGKTSSQTLSLVKKHSKIKYCYAIDDSYVHMNV